MILQLLLIVTALSLSSLAYAEEALESNVSNALNNELPNEESLSIVKSDLPNKLLWGDTHLHTSYSFDAYLTKNQKAGPDTAYRWAKGQVVKHPKLMTRVKIGTPLDFLVVSDHAEFLGVMKTINTGKFDNSHMSLWERIKSTLVVEPAIKLASRGGILGPALFSFLIPQSSGTTEDPVQDPTNKLPTEWAGDTLPAEQVAWEEIIDAAEKHNEPGKFTSLIGWEWSSVPTGANLHRVVFTPDSAEQAKQFQPYGSDQSQYPEDLWAWLDQTEKETGARFVSIPHNSNISKGYMFAETTLKNKPITAEYAKRRISWEPVVEITQLKGDSETHPELSPEDEFSNFEPFEFLIQASKQEYQATPADFVRSALKTGLSIEGKVGVNPYKFGVIGSTDAHTSLASAEEDNFYGKSVMDSTIDNKTHDFDYLTGWDFSAQGLAAVWAQDNTRDEIYAAFKRKEVYASTGPRISLRLFVGWEFPEDAVDAEDIADIGYQSGVPMGGDLTRNKAGTAPQLLIRAVKDPVGANLDRIQVVKGWLDDEGLTHEKVYNVAWSNAQERKMNADGDIAPVGNTVDMKTAHYENSIGEAELSVIWEDPNFNPEERSFYYVRVMQIPTPRHSLYDSVLLEEALPDDIASVIQERAYSSPVWYTP